MHMSTQVRSFNVEPSLPNLHNGIEHNSTGLSGKYPIKIANGET